MTSQQHSSGVQTSRKHKISSVWFLTTAHQISSRQCQAAAIPSTPHQWRRHQQTIRCVSVAWIVFRTIINRNSHLVCRCHAAAFVIDENGSEQYTTAIEIVVCDATKHNDNRLSFCWNANNVVLTSHTLRDDLLITLLAKNHSHRTSNHLK